MIWRERIDNINPALKRMCTLALGYSKKPVLFGDTKKILNGYTSSSMAGNVYFNVFDRHQTTYLYACSRRRYLIFLELVDSTHLAYD